MNSPQDLAELLKNLAKDRGIAISKVLSDCGINKNSIFTMQTGGFFPRVEALSKLATYFNVSLDYLVGLKNSNDTTEVRRRVKVLHETRDDVLISTIEQATKTSYATFRAWCNGYGDYFDTATNLSTIAQLYGVSVDALLGNSSSLLVHRKPNSERAEVAAFGGKENRAPVPQIKPEITQPQK